MVLKPSPFLRSSFIDEFGEEKDVKIRNYQAQGIMNLLVMERMILGDDTGLGKAQPTDSLVLTPTGWSRIGDLKVGDEVIGSNGRPTEVIGTYPQGSKQAFKVTMSDGSSTECCEDHLWTVRTGNSKRFGDGWHVRDLKQILSAGIIRQNGSTGLRWEIPVVDPVEFGEADLPVDPYLFGVLIGDGSMVGALNITNGDPELFEIAQKHFPPDCTYGRVSDDGYTRNVVGTIPGYNSLTRALSQMGMMGSNWYTKSIPECYLFASPRQRGELLRGLMDTDGYISKDGKVTQFFSSNGLLVRDFVRLVQSLGGVAKISSKVPTLRGKSKAKKGRLAFTVTISLPNDLVPFKLERKLRRWVPRTKYLPSRRIADIRPSRFTECVCIKVAAEDSLYVTDEFIVTHNTLEVLSAIGYVWMKEPDYVPIVITTKSALFQWGGEVQRFMKDMGAVTVHGEPFERHQAYEEFFWQHEPGKKRLLILTYDNIMRDTERAVIRDRTFKPDKQVKKDLAVARKAKKVVQDRFEEAKKMLEAYFDGRMLDIHEHMRASLTVLDAHGAVDRGGVKPGGWDSSDEAAFMKYVAARQEFADADHEVQKLNNQAAPPKQVQGIADYIKDLKRDHPQAKFMLVMDEMHKLKNHKSQFHEKTRLISLECQRIVGMTATPVKNRLMEFWSLLRIIKPDLFPKITHFQNEYCVMKMQPIGGGRSVPVVVGYRSLDKFVSSIELFYLSRKKYDVAKELPALISQEIECELYDVQEELYDMAETGAADRMDDPDATGGDMLAALTMVQQAVDSPCLIADEEGKPFEGPSSKIDALLELLEDEAAGRKIIVFSKFEKMISLIELALKESKYVDGEGRPRKGYRYVRITGKENDPKLRNRNKDLFQDPNSGIDIVLITTAGSESINLHAAEHLAFIDMPWSWGDYIQLTGRMIRIGSAHTTVVAHHFLGKRRDGTKTVDHHILQALRSKKKLADKVAGESIKGGLQFVSGDVAQDVMALIRQSQVGKRAGDKGTLLHEVNKRLAAAQPAQRPAKVKKAAPEPDLHASVSMTELDLSDL